MSTEQNKALVRRLLAAYDKLAKGEDISAEAEELLAPNARHHLPGAPVLDNAAFLQFMQAFASGFPGFHEDIEDQIAEGDKVSTRLTFHGTHTGNFQGIPPTGKQATFTGMNMLRVAGGQVVEQWGEFDSLGMLQQLGVIPAMG